MTEASQYGYVPDNLEIAPQMDFSNLWAPNDSHHFFNSTGAQPTQPAPFFQPSQNIFPSRAKPYPQDNLSGVNKQLQFMPLRHADVQSRPSASMVSKQSIQSSRRAQASNSKRQKIQARVHRKDNMHSLERSHDVRSEATRAASECCSSCPDGEICNESNCAPWNSNDIDQDPADVVACSRQSCADAACPDPCLTIGIQNQKFYSALEPQRSVGHWVQSTWNPQITGEIPERRIHPGEGLFEPQLPNFEGGEYVSTSASPAPTTPSMGNNIETPFSPNTGLPTPQFNSFSQSQNPYSNPSGTMLSGAGGMFSAAADEWSTQFGQFSRDSSLFHCTWNGCGQTIMNSHLHAEHIDPQMTFNCPIQEDGCPPTINDNPLNHLQNDHGYNFDLGDGDIGCPDPTCVEGGEVFCNPAMLHHHFDNVHAIPNQGYLHCQLDTCDTFFQGFDELLSHFVEDHKVVVPPPKDGDINLQLTAPVIRTPKNEGFPLIIKDGDVEVPDVPHTCKWKLEVGSICGRVCTSEDDLQTHLKNDHLSSLDKSSGYRCQWEGCIREKARGEEKSGFSQRGKLERHMATHTNCK
jgi:hypothetical protein